MGKTWKRNPKYLHVFTRKVKYKGKWRKRKIYTNITPGRPGKGSLFIKSKGRYIKK